MQISEDVLVAKVRRAAKRSGYTLRKSRRKLGRNVNDLGGFMILDSNGFFVLPVRASI